MLCSNCGAALKPTAKFCGACGSKLNSSDGSNTSYPSILSSSTSTLGLLPCQFNLIETNGFGPDDDGDIRIELKYSVTNNTHQTWDYLAVTTQLVNYEGQVIEQGDDSFEQTLGPGDETELEIYFVADDLKLLGQYPEKSVIVSTITACKSEFVSLGSVDIPTEAFQVASIEPIKLGESAQLLSGSIYKTTPDSDKECQVHVKALIQNLTKLPLYEVKIIADVTDKSGRELCDASSYEQLKPGELCLIQGNGYTKEKSLKTAKVELSLRCYSPVAVSTGQTNGLNLIELDSTESEEQSSSDEWLKQTEYSKEESKMKITHYINVALITGDIVENDCRFFGQDADDAFPASNWAGVFLNGEGEIIAVDSNLCNMSLSLNCVSDSSFIKALEQIVPFRSAKQSIEWLFDLSTSAKHDSILQADLPRGVSVSFTWDGDARDLETSLQNESDDEWEAKLSSFNEMFKDGRIIGIGRKNIYEMNWDVVDVAELEDKRGEGDWQRINEFCFIIREEIDEAKVNNDSNDSAGPMKRWILNVDFHPEFDEITDVNEWLDSQGYDKFFKSLNNIGVFNIVSTDTKNLSIPYDASKPISSYKSKDIVFEEEGNCSICVLLDCELSKHIKIADNKYEAIWNEIAEQVEFSGITLSVIGPMPPHLGNTTLVQQGYQHGEIDSGYFSGVDDAIVEISELPEYLLNAYKKIR
ncbi:Zinc-ribbon domain containing protein [Oxalobacteraceae bacterium]